ncbi:MAG: hypothetical protein ABIG44_06565 [Planctomycetota bacterium]
MKKFIGVDLYKKTIVICVVSHARQVLQSRRFACGETQRIAEWFAQQTPFEVMVEATASYEWFVQLVEPHAGRVVLAHPGKPHYPRGRITSIKNHIRNILADYNADRPNMFTREGVEYMREVALLGADRFVREGLLKELTLYYERIDAVEKQLHKFVKTAPPAEAAARVKSLRPREGAGRYSAGSRHGEQPDGLPHAYAGDVVPAGPIPLQSRRWSRYLENLGSERDLVCGQPP